MKLRHTLISIPTEGVWLEGVLAHNPGVRGIAIVPDSDAYRPPKVDGSRLVRELHTAGFATMTLNLLTRQEAARDPDAGYNIPRLTRRLLDAIDWIGHQPALAPLAIGVVVGGTGCAAAVRAAIAAPDRVAAIACLAGRADLAGAAPLRSLKTPTRFIVAAGSADYAICRRAFELVPLMSRDWTELDAAAADRTHPAYGLAAAQWLQRHFPPPRPAESTTAE